MTICAGFKSMYGVVLCADSQETIGALKLDVPKMVVRPSVGEADDRVRMAFAGAGDGPFIDKLTEKMWAAAEAGPGMSMEEIFSRIEDANIEWHRRLWEPYGAGSRPEAEILIALYAERKVNLYKATGPIINELDDYGFVGVGTELGSFLAERVRSGFDSLEENVAVCVFILENAKKYVDSCGGETQLAVLMRDGSIQTMDNGDVRSFEECINQIDMEIQHLFATSIDLTRQKKDVDRSARTTARTVNELRHELQEKIRNPIKVSSELEKSIEVRYRKIEWPPIPTYDEISQDQSDEQE